MKITDADRPTLKTACYSTCSGSSRDGYAYTYDPVGNIKTRVRNLAPSNTTTTYAYDASDQLCWAYQGSSSNGCSSPPTGATTYTNRYGAFVVQVWRTPVMRLGSGAECPVETVHPFGTGNVHGTSSNTDRSALPEGDNDLSGTVADWPEPPLVHEAADRVQQTIDARSSLLLNTPYQYTTTWPSVQTSVVLRVMLD